MGFRHQETRDWLGGRLQAVMEVSKSTPVLIQRGNYTSPLIDHVRGVVVTNAVLIGRQWQRSAGPKYQTQRSHEPIAPLPSVKLADSVRAPGFTGKLFLFPPVLVDLRDGSISPGVATPRAAVAYFFNSLFSSLTFPALNPPPPSPV